MWSNGVGQNRETNEERDEDCVKFDRDGEGGKEAPGMRNCSINILNESELELA